MRIGIIGTGYVGLVTGTCFADMGNDVFCVDVDEEKIARLARGEIPIYEPGLSDMVQKNSEQGRLHFTSDLSEVLGRCNILFIAVGTPMGEDGSADLSYVLQVADSIGRLMSHHLYVVDKSTVPVGTADLVREHIQEALDARGAEIDFDVISNPEFLKEGTAVSDCLNPDRIVIGVDTDEAEELMRELYKPYTLSTESLIVMDIKSAEMTKYAANSMLAMKISYMNEIANICEQVGADVNQVRRGIGSDRRIGYPFIYPGCGYGGSCFPKDVKALLRTASELGCETYILQAIENVNESQKHVLSTKVKKRFGQDLSGRKIAVWGLAFKPDTDDMRESSAITVIKDMTEAGAEVHAYDPKAVAVARDFYLKDNPCVIYHESKYDTLNEADAMVLVTEWKEFRSPDFFEMQHRMREPIIFDGRNQYDKRRMQKYGFEYFQIGVPPLKRRKKKA